MASYSCLMHLEVLIWMLNSAITVSFLNCFICVTLAIAQILRKQNLFNKCTSLGFIKWDAFGNIFACMDVLSIVCRNISVHSTHIFINVAPRLGNQKVVGLNPSRF